MSKHINSRHYIAIIHKDDDSSYGVSFPDFLGCISAGDTIEEANEMAHEALQLHVDGMMLDNETLPSASCFEDIQDPSATAYITVSIRS